MKDSVRLGCWAAFWGDTSAAVDQILDGADVQYLVSDYLSEITMALLASGGSRSSPTPARSTPRPARERSPRRRRLPGSSSGSPRSKAMT
jgi:Acyclic terpene utilisation family protein AtuA